MMLEPNESKVSLISVTPNAEKTILQIARVSSKESVDNNASIEMIRKKDKHLISHFLKNNEWSPFEHAFLTLEIVTSRAISAQLIRHRSFTFQEFCLSGETMIKIESGEKRIDQLMSTDKVMNVDKNGVIQFSSFNLLRQGMKEMIEITFDDPMIQPLTCSEEHLFMIQDGSYLPFHVIANSNNSILPIKMDLKTVKIKSVKQVGLRESFDLSIDGEIHNYVANSLIVHNSQRYSSPEGVFIYPARDQDRKNRQNSLTTTSPENEEWFRSAQIENAKRSGSLYNEAIQRGIAKESARFLLPMSVASRVYMTGSLRSWMTYFMTRLQQFDKNKQDAIHIQYGANGPSQTEHYELAEKCLAIFSDQFPLISECMTECQFFL